MAKSSDVTPKLLEKILGAIQTTNHGLEELHQEVAELRTGTTRRLDLLTEAATRTNTELVGVNERLGKLESTVGKLEKTVERNGERFEHALITQGASHRELENRVARLEAHVGIES